MAQGWSRLLPCGVAQHVLDGVDIARSRNNHTCSRLGFLAPVAMPTRGLDNNRRRFAHLTSCVHCCSARRWSLRGDARGALRPCCERHTTQQTGFVYRLYPVCTYVLGPEKDQRGMQWMFKE